MKFSSMTIAALIAAIPAMSVADPIFPVAPTQSVSASLSASFGEGANLTSPSSISVSAAAGLMAVSTGVATGVSSATSAGSSAAAELLPSAVIAFNDVSKSYETEIAFENINAIDVDKEINDAITAFEAKICGEGFFVADATDLETDEFRTNRLNGEVLLTSAFGADVTAVDIEGEVTVSCAANQPE